VIFGAPHRHFRVIESTNTAARELAAAGAPGGTIVTASEQPEGRGRQGRAWHAVPGSSLVYSAILRPLEARHALLPLAVPLAVCDAAESLAAVACQVKWPNDVWIDGRKAAGILIEARPQDHWAVIGVGLNVSLMPNDFPGELRDTSASIGMEIRVADALAALNRELGRWVDAPQDAVLAEFRRRDGLRGREIEWADGSGKASGIADDGNLLVRTATGDEVSLGAGEVHLRVGA
jgi:BirA family biotin operon repressor/biotin-[acetyl-CoA-carboxylase] ligase